MRGRVLLGAVLAAGLAGIADDWWKRRRRSAQRLCYRTKSEALQDFREANRGIIDRWGGLDAIGRAADFDAINHKYDLRGRRKVKTLARAIWHAMPARAPFCLDEIDLETLNETAPGQKGSGFRLPDHAYDAVASREQERYYRELALDEPPF